MKLSAQAVHIVEKSQREVQRSYEGKCSVFTAGAAGSSTSAALQQPGPQAEGGGEVAGHREKQEYKREKNEAQSEEEMEQEEDRVVDDS